MQTILWIITIYFIIAVSLLMYLLLSIKYSKSIREYYQNRVDAFAEKHPDFNRESIEDVVTASFVRFSILWPKFFYDYLKDYLKGKFNENKRRNY